MALVEVREVSSSFATETGQSFVLGRETVLQATHPNTHVMSLYLTPDGHRGLVRGVTERLGDVGVAGFFDKSTLYLVSRDASGEIKIDKKDGEFSELLIHGEEALIASLPDDSQILVGKEDPTIVVDEANVTHIFCTYLYKGDSGVTSTYLIHASGPDLEHLEMGGIVLDSAKEVTMVPANSEGIRLPLYEGSVRVNGQDYSTVGAVRIAQTESLDTKWHALEHPIINPAEPDTVPEWLRGHASPGPILRDLGDGFLLMFLNGRGVNKVSKTQQGEEIIEFAPFEIGFCIYDYEKGVVVGISKDAIITGAPEDNVTFASCFDPDRHILYAHVNDSRVDAISLDLEGLMKFVQDPNNFFQPDSHATIDS